MPTQPSGYGPPKVKGYSVELEPEARRAPGAAARSADRPQVKVLIHGEGFIARAMRLIIKIGDVRVKDYQVTPDQRTLICHLDEMPEEGAVITVGYGREQSVELPERFSRSKLAEEEPNA